MKNCRLVGLLDLDQGSSYVRGKMKEYLEELIDIGVAGFRFDASKHMWPQDLQALLDSLKNLKADVAFFYYLLRHHQLSLSHRHWHMHIYRLAHKKFGLRFSICCLRNRSYSDFRFESTSLCCS